MSRDPASMGWVGQISRGVVCLLLGYYALYALVAPLTNIDSQIYNVARLELAARGGFFGSPWFTSIYQVIWPWTYDAVHLPFIGLGWGYALPSFACFAGTCFVVHAMVRSKFGPEAAWVAVTGLLGLTCLAYQATSTKNDIPLLFCGAAWAYARWRRKKEGRDVHLFWMILAIGFMAGAKMTGSLYAALLSGWTLWELRRERKLRWQVGAGLAAAFVVLGSGEVYVEAARIFGRSLGPRGYMRAFRNSDGVPGAVANFSRYVAGGIYLGPAMRGERAATPAVKGEQAFLASTGLTDKGMAAGMSDSSLYFFQSGFEELSGFGPVGSAAMATMLLAAFFWRPRAVWWQLAAIALGGMLLLSYSVGYSFWGNRYLIGWYALATVACVCALWRPGMVAGAFLRPAFALCALASALAAPLLSFNRGPSAIKASLVDRERFETCSYPLAGKVRGRLRELRRLHPGSQVFFVACNDSVVWPLLEDPLVNVALVTPPRFLALMESGGVAQGDFVIEDCPSGAARLVAMEEVTAPDVFSKGQVRRQTIYQVGPGL